MKRPARIFLGCAIVFCAAHVAHAQSTLQPTPPPSVTAETEEWYHNGEPVMLGGGMYDRGGPQVHFNRNEMVYSGMYRGIPVYSRVLVIEPLGVVYVPLSGGLMQPYERRIDRAIGTAGPFSLSTAEIAPGTGVAASPVLQAAAFPTLGSPIAFNEMAAGPSGAPTPLLMAQTPDRVATSGRATNAPSSVGRAGRAAPARARRASRVPQAANGVFIEFDNSRWFSSGPATLFNAKSFTRVGELRGFPVYTTRGRGATIFVPVAEGLDLVAPYSKRDNGERRAPNGK
jgi:hypothetical protein